MSWKDEPWLIIDTETTGIDVEQDRIVQLGAVVLEKGEMVDRRLVTIHPGIAIPDGAAQVHGITDAAVEGRPTFAEVFGAFANFLEPANVICSYNGIGFDWPLIWAEVKRLDIAEPSFSSVSHRLGLESAMGDALFIDVIVHIRRHSIGKFWPGSGRHKLANVARRLEITLPPGMRPHRADADCYIAGMALWDTRNYLPDDVDEVRELLEDRQADQAEERREWEAGGRDAWLAKKGQGPQPGDGWTGPPEGDQNATGQPQTDPDA